MQEYLQQQKNISSDGTSQLVIYFPYFADE